MSADIDCEDRRLEERMHRVRDAVADAMIEFGPDGHIDGCDEIAEAAIRAWQASA